MVKNWQELQKRLMKQHKHHNYLSIYTVSIFAVGAAAGAAAGMLMAPEKGEQTRVRLIERVQAGLNMGQKKMMALADTAKHKMSQANKKAQSTAEKSKRATTPSAPTRQTPAAI